MKLVEDELPSLKELQSLEVGPKQVTQEDEQSWQVDLLMY
jgi:hypothetical protein